MSVWVVWNMNEGESPSFELCTSADDVSTLTMGLIGKYDRVGSKRFDLSERDDCTTPLVADIQKALAGLAWCVYDTSNGCGNSDMRCPYELAGCTRRLYDDVKSLLLELAERRGEA